MKRKQLFILLGCAVLCLGILAVLYTVSPLNKEISRSNFTRKFEMEVILRKKASLDLGFNSYYIAGTTKDQLYLGNSTAPFHLLITNTALTDSQHVELKLVGLDSLMDPTRFKLTVDSPYFFLAHGTMPELLRGRLNQWEARHFIDGADYFAEAVPLGSSSFALRSYSMSQKSYELAKKSSVQPFKFEYDLLQKQIDGLFCLDGTLHYAKALKQLIYLHYYRNEFTVADSNLNLVYRGHTIDTFSHAHVKVAYVKSRNENMLSRPPAQINGISSVSGKYLFVQSHLLAKNEDMENYLRKSVIDVYNLANGQYKFSFYISNYKNKRPNTFIVFGNHLAAIFDQELVVYELDQGAFK